MRNDWTWIQIIMLCILKSPIHELRLITKFIIRTDPRKWRPDDFWNMLLKEMIDIHDIQSLDNLQKTFGKDTREYMKRRIYMMEKINIGIWPSMILKDLLDLRHISVWEERRILSKRIQKYTRRYIQKYRSNETHRILDEFKDRMDCTVSWLPTGRTQRKWIWSAKRTR